MEISLLIFHKLPDVKLSVLVEPSQSEFLDMPGIARYCDWWVVFGYTSVCPIQFLRDYLTKRKDHRACAIFDRTLKNKKPIL